MSADEKDRLAVALESIEDRLAKQTDRVVVPQWVMISLVGVFLSVQVLIGGWMVEVNASIATIQVQLEDIVDTRMDRQGERISDNHEAILRLQELHR